MMKSDEDLKYEIALTLIPGIGPVIAKHLLHHFGTARKVFDQKMENLVGIEAIGTITAEKLIRHNVFRRAEQEVSYVRKHGISTVFYNDEDYPFRLKQCTDAPILLYYRGNCKFNSGRYIGIVGTRTPTDYGLRSTEILVQTFKDNNITVVSGLAYGIDIKAHQCSLENGIPTMGVVAHGLHTIYPPMHEGIAIEMEAMGGIITEYPHGIIPDKENFPSRNRIVAGMCDAIVVVESAEKGGALITAEIANSYARDVFAYPGRVGDRFSIGCNRIIRQNKAALLCKGEELLEMMGWKELDFLKLKKLEQQKKQIQTSLFLNLDSSEKKIVEILTQKNMDIDNLSIEAEMPMSKISVLLFGLEMKGVVQCKPGKVYAMV